MFNRSQNARPPCPYCGSSQISKNGSTHHKKQKYLCKECRRLSWWAFPCAYRRRGVSPQFIENPTKKSIQPSTKALIKRLLLEKIPLIGIARSLQISMTWLQKFVNDFYRCIPCQSKVTPETSLELVIECDELWSFVNSKENAVYVWLAINRKTRQIVGVHLGDRSRNSAQVFWESLRSHQLFARTSSGKVWWPQEYRERAIVYTDLWSSNLRSYPPLATSTEF